jgi:very-short-patch-repair endonuclease
MMRRAGELRKNQTRAEAKLWSRLRAHHLDGVQFRRQHAIGNYIVDFCAPRRKLIIEVDGSQHVQQVEDDQERTEYLESKGYRLLRFWNRDVLKDIDTVMNAVWRRSIDNSPAQRRCAQHPAGLCAIRKASTTARHQDV